MRRYQITVIALAFSVVLVTACGSATAGGPSATPVATATSSTAPSTPTATIAPVSPTPAVTPLAVVQVKIVDQKGMFAFDPATLKVKVGTQVVWSNDSSAPHTVSSNTGVFDTPDPLGINPGQTYAFTFTKPGTYPYYCNIHTYMTASIVVTG